MTEQFITYNPISSIPVTANAPAVNRHSFLSRHFAVYKFHFAAVVFWGLIHSCSSFFLTLIIGDFFMLQFDTGSSKGKLLAWLGITLSTTVSFFLLFALLLLVKFTSSYFEKYLSTKEGELFVKNIRQKLFEAQMGASPAMFANRTYGKYLLRYSNDMKAVQNYLSRGVLGGIKDFVFVLLALLILLKISMPLTFVLIALLLATAVLSKLLWARQKKYVISSRDKRSGLLAFVTRSFGRFAALQRDGKEREVVERFYQRSDGLYTANLENGKVESVLQSVIPVLQFSIIGIVLLLMATGRVQVNAADGLIIILMLMLMQGALRRLLRVPGILNRGRISLDKINGLIVMSQSFEPVRQEENTT